jgi:hypothetical protein
MSNNRKTPKYKAVHDAATVQPRRNEKGEIVSWNTNSDDGRLLKMLVESGHIKPGMTAGEARKKYSMFCNYSYSCFGSALTNARKSLGTEIDAREQQTGRGGRSGKIQSYSNLMGPEDDDDDDGDDETFQMSRMSVDDRGEGDDLYSSFDNRTQAKSVSFNHISSGRSIRSATTHGAAPSPGGMRTQGIASSSSTPPRSPYKMAGSRPLSCSLPYIIDYWHDLRPQERASVQIQMLSMKDLIQRVTYRVSTAKNELVIVMPVSQYFGEPTDAFNHYVLGDIGDADAEKQRGLLVWHPKSNARRLHLAELRKRSPSVNTTMEFRIPLRRKFSLDFATVANNDPYFYGAKFVHYPDGSLFLHCELVADTVEGTNNPLDRNNAEMVDLKKSSGVPGSVSVPSGGEEDDNCSFMDVTVNTGVSRSVPAAGALPPALGSPAPAAAITAVSPAATTVIYAGGTAAAGRTTADAASTYSGFSGNGASHQDARSVKSRLTTATSGTNKRKMKTRGGGDRLSNEKKTD